jgi:hypothetical protein
MRSKVGAFAVSAIAACAALGAPAALATTPAPFFNGFETDIHGWDVYGGQYDATRVPSGTDGVTSRTGSFHAEAGQYSLDQDGGSAATDWGGSTDEFPAGGYTTEVDVYLDTNCPANDTRFDWSSAVSNTAGNHRRDFVFNAGCYTAGGNHFTISASTNAGRGGAFPANPDKDPVNIYTTGWYRLRHTFYDNGGVLAVDMSILDANGNVVKSWTRSDPSDVIGVTVGGAQYGWFASNEFPFLAFDNSRLIVERQGSFSCQAQALRAGSSATAVANPQDSPCRDDEAALDTLSPAVLGGITGLSVSAQTLHAQTEQAPDDLDGSAPAAGDHGSSEASVEKLVLRHNLARVTIRAITASASASCEAGDEGLSPQLSSSSAVASVQVGNGTPIDIGSTHTNLKLRGFGTLHLNDETIDGNEVVRRAVWLERPGADVVAGEASADYADRPCG